MQQPSGHGFYVEIMDSGCFIDTGLCYHFQYMCSPMPDPLPAYDNEQQRRWLELRQYTPEQLEIANLALDEIRAGGEVWQAIRHHPLSAGGYIPKHLLVAVYHQGIEAGDWEEDPDLLARIRMKPIRTLSGVTTVTVLTKAHPCPGECIFCPTEDRMPKSYLPDEPGARRGVQHGFDPFDQVSSRINSLEAVGHPTDKIELLILGGTWDAYPRDYQEEFIRRCFDAMNESDSSNLAEAHRINESCSHRNVGLVIETRPDQITPEELAWLRKLGVTKVQMGAQSLDDRILSLNRRGHTVADTVKAMSLLRAGGFKVVLHWMPNLLGATPESDREDFTRFWQTADQGVGLCPDEIKIYPTQLLRSAELFKYWERGEYKPYAEADLIHLIADVKAMTPRYCRINRVIRDIPSTNIVEGSKHSSLRQNAQLELDHRGQRCQCIRCREVRGQVVDAQQLCFNDLVYQASGSEEHFLSFETPDDRLAGYLRLSFPNDKMPERISADLEGAAIIREVHVYGQSLAVGATQSGAAQHSGLGTRLIEQAEALSIGHGFSTLAVISAIGTREYYAGRDFGRGALYMLKSLQK
jgi:elongator complex protein 3